MKRPKLVIVSFFSLLTLGLGLCLCLRVIPALSTHGTSLVSESEYQRFKVPPDSIYPQFGTGFLYRGKKYVLSDFSESQETNFEPNCKFPIAGTGREIVDNDGISVSPGKFLFVGGRTSKRTGTSTRMDALVDGRIASSTWVMNTVTHKIFEGTRMHEARIGPNLKKLSSGQILISGGYTADHSGLSDSIEIYDPVSCAVSYVCRMHEARQAHCVCELSDGRILIAGGNTKLKSETNMHVTSSIELLDLKKYTIGLAGQLHEARRDAVAFPLDHNQALICAGTSGREISLSGEIESLTSIELFAPDLRH